MRRAQFVVWLAVLLGAVGASAQTAPLASLDESLLKQFRSYRILLKFSYDAKDKSGKRHREEIKVVREFRADEAAQRLELTNVDLASKQRATEIFYQLGGLSYVYPSSPIKENPACLPVVNQSEYANFLLLFNPRAYIGSVRTAEREAQGEQVNGIQTARYTFDQVQFGEFKSMRGKVWVAQEGGYIVRYLGQATGSTQVGLIPLTGSFSWEYTLEAIDAVPLITLPPACIAASLGPDIPWPPGARLTMNSPEVMGFSSGNAVHALVTFYRGALPKNGWRIIAPSGPLTAQGWSFTAAKDTRTIRITITESTLGGSGVSVTRPEASP
jgi:hypothetical protein